MSKKYQTQKESKLFPLYSDTHVQVVFMQLCINDIIMYAILRIKLTATMQEKFQTNTAVKINVYNVYLKS